VNSVEIPVDPLAADVAVEPCLGQQLDVMIVVLFTDGHKLAALADAIVGVQVIDPVSAPNRYRSA
jgi:hypothetical protein